MQKVIKSNRTPLSFESTKNKKIEQKFSPSSIS